MAETLFNMQGTESHKDVKPYWRSA